MLQGATEAPQLETGCEKGVYDEASGKCLYEPEVDIACADGSYNRVTGKCEVEPNTDIVCLRGTYDSSIKNCIYYPQVENVCEEGVYNSIQGFCELAAELVPSCEKGSYDSSKDKCVYTPETSALCSVGSYDAGKDKCVTNPQKIYVCDTGVLAYEGGVAVCKTAAPESPSPSTPGTDPGESEPAPVDDDPPEPDEGREPWTLETEDFTLGIQRITLNDDKDNVDEVELLFEKSSSPEMHIALEIWRGETKYSSYVLAAGNYPPVYIRIGREHETTSLASNYFKLSTPVEDNNCMDQLTGCSVYKVKSILDVMIPGGKYGHTGVACKNYNRDNFLIKNNNKYCGPVALEQIDYISNDCASLWRPCSIPPGDYELRVRLYEYVKSEHNVLGVVRKVFQLGPDAPKIQ